MRRKEMVHPAKLPETLKLEFLLVERCMHHQKDRVRPNMSRGRELAKDNLKTNPITIKSKRVSHIAEQFSWVPLPCCSLPWLPFPIKPFVLFAHVYLQTIHFRMSDKSLFLGSGRDPLPATCKYKCILREYMKTLNKTKAFFPYPGTVVIPPMVFHWKYLLNFIKAIFPVNLLFTTVNH